MSECEHFELVIIGGGPAGLSGALIAARARRKVLLVNGGIPRNEVSESMHCFLSRDGIDPTQFKNISIQEIETYSTAQFREGMVGYIGGNKGNFVLQLHDTGGDGVRALRLTTITASRVMLALGLQDILPDIPGIDEYWGKGVYHCPYCEGYEYSDKKWGLLANDDDITEALFMKAWTSDLIYLANGQAMTSQKRQVLEKHGIQVELQKVANINGHNDALLQIMLEDGNSHSVDSLWVTPQHKQRGLVKSLETSHGLALDDMNEIARNEHGETSVQGIYAAGDIAADGIKQAILAAGDGARVALCINKELIHEAYY